MESKLRFLRAEAVLREYEIVDVDRDDVVAVEAALHHEGREADPVPAGLGLPAGADQAFVAALLAALQAFDERIEVRSRDLLVEELAHLATHLVLERVAATALELLVGEDEAELAVHDGDRLGNVLREIAQLRFLLLERAAQLVVFLDVDE